MNAEKRRLALIALEKQAIKEMAPRTWTSAQLRAAVDGWLAGYVACVEHFKMKSVLVETTQGEVMLPLNAENLKQIKEARDISYR